MTSLTHSETCDEAIRDITQFLRQNPPESYTSKNASRVVAKTLRQIKDPCETLQFDRAQCRSGQMLGTLNFLVEEMKAIQETLSHSFTFARAAEQVPTRLHLMGLAAKAIAECSDLLTLHRNRLARIKFDEAREAVRSVAAICPTPNEDISMLRVQHAIALASDLMGSVGK